MGTLGSVLSLRLKLPEESKVCYLNLFLKEEEGEDEGSQPEFHAFDVKASLEEAAFHCR